MGPKFSLTIDEFETSLGAVDCDMEILEEMMLKGSKLDIGVDENSHRYEHSIEVQLPFLQMIQKKFKIVPVLVRDLDMDDIRNFGKILAEIVRKGKKEVFILVSSDFTHYGRNYGFVPFVDDISENLYELDGKIISKILEQDVQGFLDEAGKSTICGKDAIACLIEASKILKLKAEKLCYYTSGDVSEDWDSAVGYASIGFS
jgi:hypothetical protein